MMNLLPLTLAAAVFVGGTVTTVGRAHAETQTKTLPGKTASIDQKAMSRATASRKPMVAKARAKARRAKLPREWVWKKYTKSFDHMFRAKKK